MTNKIQIVVVLNVIGKLVTKRIIKNPNVKKCRTKIYSFRRKLKLNNTLYTYNFLFSLATNCLRYMFKITNFFYL